MEGEEDGVIPLLLQPLFHPPLAQVVNEPEEEEEEAEGEGEAPRRITCDLLSSPSLHGHLKQNIPSSRKTGEKKGRILLFSSVFVVPALPDNPSLPPSLPPPQIPGNYHINQCVKFVTCLIIPQFS